MVNKRLRVLSVTKSTGGLAFYNRDLCKRLDRDKFDMHVLCLSENNEKYAAEMRALGVTAYTMEMNRYAIDFLGDFRLARQLIKLVREGNFDVIIGHGSKAGFLVRLAERMTGVPAIYALATMSFVPRIHGKKAYAYRIIEKFGSLLGGHIATVAYSNKDQLLKYGIAPADRVTVIQNCIDLDRFNGAGDPMKAKESLKLDPNRPVVGWAARFMPQKAPLDFIRAAAKVVASVPDVQIFMAGEGEFAPEVDAFIKEHKLQNNVTRAIWQADVVLMLKAFDIYVSSSHWEGLPLSVLEAMAMGCATVATAVDGTREVIEHGKTGYLVEAGAIDDLAHHIIDLLNNPAQRRQIAAAGQQHIRSHFGIQKMINEWEALLEKVTAAS
jgi:glycosyltransferase involved in cell wall biosynthesis